MEDYARSVGSRFINIEYMHKQELKWKKTILPLDESIYSVVQSELLKARAKKLLIRRWIKYIPRLQFKLIEFLSLAFAEVVGLEM